MPKLVSLSASRVKVFENCSWLYFCQYIKKLPQIPNDGALKGSICHLILEVLQNKRHFHHYHTIVEKKSILASQSITKLVNKYIIKLSLQNSPNIFGALNNMILVGLVSDFFIKNGELVATEFEFDIENENPKYRIKGFMDKPVKVGNEIIIDDYKSSKKKFAGEDQESNLQALIYSLAAKKLWPHLNPKVRFIFLQYPTNPMMELQFSNDALRGLEYYLEETSKQLSSFNEYDAKRNLASNIEPPNNEFKGKLLCGFAKQPGQLKKDGTKMWYCSYKFPYDYFHVKFPDGTEENFLEEQEIPHQENLTITKKHYGGCPAFFSSALDFKIAKIVPQNNVLEDF